MPVKWKETIKPVKLITNIEVVAVDRDGLALDILKVLQDCRAPLHNINSRLLKNGNAVVDVTVDVDGTDQLNNLVGKIRRIRSVITVDRARK